MHYTIFTTLTIYFTCNKDLPKVWMIRPLANKMITVASKQCCKQKKSINLDKVDECIIYVSTFRHKETTPRAQVMEEEKFMIL